MHGFLVQMSPPSQKSEKAKSVHQYDRILYADHFRLGEWLQPGQSANCRCSSFGHFILNHKSQRRIPSLN